MTKTHEHLQRSWDLFNESAGAVPPEAFIGLWKAVDEICKRVDKLERSQRGQAEWLNQALNEGDGTYKP